MSDDPERDVGPIDSVQVHMGEAWTCHVCKRERADPFISVRQFTVAEEPVPVVVNVRYCNDTDACYEGATDVSFLKAAMKVFSS